MTQGKILQEVVSVVVAVVVVVVGGGGRPASGVAYDA